MEGKVGKDRRLGKCERKDQVGKYQEAMRR